MSYLYLSGDNKVKQFFADILTYWVLYSNLVPIRFEIPLLIFLLSEWLLIADQLIRHRRNRQVLPCVSH